MSRSTPINSSHYIVVLDQAPVLVSATAWHGFLWDNTTRMPLINQKALANLSLSEQKSIRQIVEASAAHDVRELLRRARRATCEPVNNRDENAVLERRAFFKREFYPLAQLFDSPALKNCLIQQPSHLPVPYKLMTGQLTFGPDEIRELAKNIPVLEKSGHPELVDVLAHAGFIERASRPSPAPAPPLSPDNLLDFTAQWYGLKNAKNLAFQAQLWNGVTEFFHFVADRSDWTGRSIERILRQFEEMIPPTATASGLQPWRQMLAKQMRKPFGSEPDLIQLAPHFADVVRYGEQKRIRIDHCSPDQLMAMAPKLQNRHVYRDAKAHPEIAAHCEAFRLSETTFTAAVHTMAAASPQDKIPHVRVDGGHFAMPGFEIIKLAKQDPLNLFAGAMVNCCGHIGGKSKRKVRMVKATVTNPDVGTFVLRDTSNGSIAGKTIAWLSPTPEQEHDFVINSWHLHPPQNKTTFQNIMTAMAVAIQEECPAIRHVYSGGQSGDFPVIDNSRGIIAPAEPSLRTCDTDKLFLVRARPALTVADRQPHCT